MSRTLETVRGYVGVSVGPRFETFGRTIRVSAIGSDAEGGGALMTPAQACELGLELMRRSLNPRNEHGEAVIEQFRRFLAEVTK